MNLTGIITEYNPFHNGHKLHLETAKHNTNADGIICVMSGNFVQRGEAALLDKWTRTQIALENGVDLVIELPTYYALSSAEKFAFGSVSILNSLNCVNNLFFGSEIGDVTILQKIATILTDEPIEYKENLKYFLNQGLSFPSARENSLFKILGNEVKDVISSSNNILGIEYIKSLLTLNSKIIPSTLKREGSTYNDENLSITFSSATAIRASLKSSETTEIIKNTVPEPTYKILKEKLKNIENLNFQDEMFKYIKFKLITSCVNFNNLSDANEGIDNKLLKEIYNSNTYEEFVFKCKSKRYTYTKISRILTKIFIGIDSFDEIDLNNVENLYCRVLGFNTKGREILKYIKKNSDLKLITKVGKFTDNPLLDLDIQATKAYSLLNKNINPNMDYLQSPIILD
ncbi:MAG: nucleotidyltransferase [Clostridium sp.]